MKTELGQPKRILSEESRDMFPEKDHFKRKMVFQPSFFKGHVSFRGSSWNNYSKFVNFLNNASDHHIHPITQNKCLCSNPISCVLFFVGSVCHFLLFLFPNFNNSFTFNPHFCRVSGLQTPCRCLKKNPPRHVSINFLHLQGMLQL